MQNVPIASSAMNPARARAHAHDSESTARRAATRGATPWRS